MKTRCLLVALALTTTASATVRVFVTASGSPCGLENGANHMLPTVSTVDGLNGDTNAYDYWADYYGTIPGPIRPGGFPPVDAPSGTPASPVTIGEGDFAYIWLQFQDEPKGVQINGLKITIRELGQTTPAAVSTTYYVCNNKNNIINNKRWDGMATPPAYPEWHHNPQWLVAVAACGLPNSEAGAPWNLWQGSSHIALLGAVEAPADDKTYEIQIDEISYWTPPNPLLAGGVFRFASGGPRIVPAGLDCWQTGCGRTQYSFHDTPLPPDFFDPGSAPFAGIVPLRGAQTGAFDARIERLNEMVFDAAPSTAGSAIRAEYLELVSCQPIRVLANGQPVLWDVAVGLSDNGPPPQGSLVVTRTHNNGGTYTAQFSVQPVFIFTRVEPPHDQRIFDTGLLGLPPPWFTTVGEAPFVFQLAVNDPVFACGTNFAPGIEEDPPGQPQHWRFVSHVAGGPNLQSHFLETRPPGCIGSPDGACYLPNGLCAVMGGRDACDAAGGRWQGAGTDCRTPIPGSEPGVSKPSAGAPGPVRGR
jgi:hypothetical protein